MAVIKTLLLLGIVVASACGDPSAPPSLEARTVVRTAQGQFCSIFVDDPKANLENQDAISPILTYIDSVRSSTTNVAASYLELKSTPAVTLTAAGPCSGQSWVSKAERVAETMGLRASAPFTPAVRSLPASGSTPSGLSEVLRRLNGPESSLAACSMAIRLSPSLSADADRRFQSSLARARDDYGIPILFSAQKNNVLYISFYRQCGDKAAVFDALRSISLRDPSHGVNMLGFDDASDRELKEVYGSVF